VVARGVTPHQHVAEPVVVLGRRRAVRPRVLCRGHGCRSGTRAQRSERGADVTLVLDRRCVGEPFRLQREHRNGHQHPQKCNEPATTGQAVRQARGSLPGRAGAGGGRGGCRGEGVRGLYGGRLGAPSRTSASHAYRALHPLLGWSEVSAAVVRARQSRDEMRKRTDRVRRQGLPAARSRHPSSLLPIPVALPREERRWFCIGRGSGPPESGKADN
jgi:hypothetical protein